MTPSTRKLIAFFIMTTAAVTFILATTCMLKRLNPFYTWYYVFSWWSYIFFLESLLFVKGGDSTLFASPGRFLVQLPLSITIWLIFESFNFRLHNWHYIQAPSSLPLRWIGYSISFATVLPGLNTTTRFLRHLEVFNSSHSSSFTMNQETSAYLMAGGAVSLVLPLLWPKVFFPLVWLGFGMLLAPVQPGTTRPSLLQDIQSGRPRELLELLLAGMICGLLWEFWNFWAGAKWVYSVPYVGWLKVFEMPFLGFLGFPPFAVQCYLMAGSATHLWKSFERGLNPMMTWSLRASFGILLLAFWLFVYAEIDRRTVLTFGE